MIIKDYSKLTPEAQSDQINQLVSVDNSVKAEDVYSAYECEESGDLIIRVKKGVIEDPLKVTYVNKKGGGVSYLPYQQNIEFKTVRSGQPVTYRVHAMITQTGKDITGWVGDVMGELEGAKVDVQESKRNKDLEAQNAALVAQLEANNKLMQDLLKKL